jgi:hypothetical protein
VERQYVGIDLHRRRSVIVRKNSAGEVLSKVRIENSPMALAEAVAAAGASRSFVLAPLRALHPDPGSASTRPATKRTATRSNSTTASATPRLP